MIKFLRQGWSLCLIGVVLLALSFSACDESESYEPVTFEEGIEEDLFEEEVFPVVDDKEEDIFSEEKSLEFKVENYSKTYEPELASLPPVEDVISDSEWEEITEGISFERTEKEKPKERPDINPGMDFGKGLETGLSTVAWVLVIALIVGFLAWLIIRTKVDTKVDKVRDFSLTDELLAASKEELADALTQNLNRKDYRAAIRYRFGQLLQAMRKEGLLVWVPGRTNAEYQSSLKSPFFEPFGVLAKAFSYAMYSGRDVTEAHYENFASTADDFLAQLSPKLVKR